MSKENEIAQLIAPVVAEHGLYLEQVRLKNAQLRITLDLPEGPGGVDSAQLTAATRAISKVLDAADPIAGAYNLEITTPGAERELLTPRHFSRAIGRLISFSAGGVKQRGRVVAATQSHVQIDTGEVSEYEIDQLSAARIELEF